MRIDLDEARDMADFGDEPQLSLDELDARNARWEWYRAERVMKGRPKWRVTTTQPRPDWKHYPVRETVAPDPILDLKTARSWAIDKPFDPATQQRYGEVRQRVVSPVFLPRDLEAV